MHDEAEAEEEIKALSANARMYLQHVLRNGLQSISGMVELRDLATARDVIHELAHKLRRMGL